MDFQGVVYEFRIPEREDPSLEQFHYAWRFGNGMFGLILTFGLIWTAVKSRRARSWRFASGMVTSIVLFGLRFGHATFVTLNELS
jgi:hypothetical protein